MSQPINSDEAFSPMPIVKAEFAVEPHPDLLVRKLVAEIEFLRAENQRLKEELYGADTR